MRSARAASVDYELLRYPAHPLKGVLTANRISRSGHGCSIRIDATPTSVAAQTLRPGTSPALDLATWPSTPAQRRFSRGCASAPLSQFDAAGLKFNEMVASWPNSSAGASEQLAPHENAPLPAKRMRVVLSY